MPAPLPMGRMNSLQAFAPAAQEIAGLWWLLFGVALVVTLLVFAGLFLALRRAGRNEHELPHHPLDAPRKGNRAVLLYGAIIPTVILTVVFGFAVRSLNVLAGPPAREDGLTVQVIGHQFWWEMRYLLPGQDEAIPVANEMWLPVGQRVRIELTSPDVIHSFWVPSLHGKQDTIPGQLNEFWIEAGEPGLYRGICAEFCGEQHANMHFLLRAVSDGEFENWLARQAEDAVNVDGNALAMQGRQLFSQSGCAACHVVRGVQARGLLGPDLTHFASRETLGAGIRPNNRGNLAGWIMNPHGIKRGVRMPPADLSAHELAAMLAYLEALQ